ncbi:MAG: hypothetical protein LUD74_00770 [Tannerellaceae bacterium]|nr:hypothetical protein [Tannerellaceae bacterium]
MEKLQNRLCDQNLREVNQIKSLLLEFCKSPDLILLYGELVDDTPRSVAGGYELLVVMREADMVDREELLDYLKEHYPVAVRMIRRIDVQILATEFFRVRVQQNLYLNPIFRNGIVLYNPVAHLWDHMDTRRKVKQKVIRLNHESVIRHIYFADIFYEISSCMLQWKDWRLNPFLMYYCVEHLCIAMELHVYGFTRDYQLLSQRFDIVKEGSLLLYRFREERKDNLSRLFRKLTKYRDKYVDAEHCRGYQLESLLSYEKLIEEMIVIVKKECGWPEEEEEEVTAESCLSVKPL